MSKTRIQKPAAHKSNQFVLALKSNQCVLAPNQFVLGTKSDQDVVGTDPVKPAEALGSSTGCQAVGVFGRYEEHELSGGTYRSSQEDDNHKLCAEVHQALCDAVAPEGGDSCRVLAEWLKTPLSLAATGRGEVLGDFCVEMSKVVDLNLDGFWMYEAPKLDVTSDDFKANVEQVVSALVKVRDASREPYCSSDRCL